MPFVVHQSVVQGPGRARCWKVHSHTLSPRDVFAIQYFHTQPASSLLWNRTLGRMRLGASGTEGLRGGGVEKRGSAQRNPSIERGWGQCWLMGHLEMFYPRPLQHLHTHMHRHLRRAVHPCILPNSSPHNQSNCKLMRRVPTSSKFLALMVTLSCQKKPISHTTHLSYQFTTLK